MQNWPADANHSCGDGALLGEVKRRGAAACGFTDWLTDEWPERQQKRHRHHHLRFYLRSSATHATNRNIITLLLLRCYAFLLLYSMPCFFSCDIKQPACARAPTPPPPPPSPLSPPSLSPLSFPLLALVASGAALLRAPSEHRGAAGVFFGRTTHNNAGAISIWE